ncbi:TetR/AcrR family transcriptional regulator [Luteimonas sp. BDR2-5]|uniref:TetR/AcrR family transcriptional regulator n=1 Tax=Proluteimonas luteida TaxID=2878685 RepID=UPI001E51A815|nr:TetR/AcrR family transcriptional regulator [Luteimonas sp. BDR2-5]MCD9029540.1 TetR/AcrR family transcriptional regulator [Luteimonas sp. BDR2-5]
MYRSTLGYRAIPVPITCIAPFPLPLPMPPAPSTRLTREQSRQQTRHRLLESARRQIAATGIASATIRSISEAAGFSLGAFYSNFESKDDMLVALMEDQLEALTGAFADTMHALAAQPLDQALVQLAQWLASLHEDRDNSRLMLELHMHAGHDPVFGKAYLERRKAYMDSFVRGLELLYSRSPAPLSISPEQMATGFIALWNGFSIQPRDSRSPEIREIYLAFLQAFFAER